MHRRGQFLLDFIEAENSSGFHAGGEAMRVAKGRLIGLRWGKSWCATRGRDNQPWPSQHYRPDSDADPCADRPDRARHRQPRISARGGGNITLFAFDAGQGLTEHTSPFEAFASCSMRSR